MVDRKGIGIGQGDRQQPKPRRSQFVLSPHPVAIPGWSQMRLGERLCLTFHPDLTVYRTQQDGCSLTLLGFVLDWRNPVLTSEAIVDKLLESSPTLDACIKSTEELCGRWIFVYQSAHENALFHDVSASRQVCYVNTPKEKQLWCASQPDLLAELAHLQPDTEANAFITEYARETPEYWYPGDRLPFRDSKVLLPNHCLDLDTGLATRYWPYSDRVESGASDVVARVVPRFRGVMQAASNRFHLALGLSAGWDSRVVLAACRDISKNIDVYSARRKTMSRRHPDFEVPVALSRRLGLNHQVIRQKTKVSQPFWERVEAHTSQPHAFSAPAMESEFQCFRCKRVAVIGNISEVAKRPGGGWLADLNRINDELSARGKRFDAETIATVLDMGESDFVIKAFTDWLADIPELYGYKLPDLFYLEQGCGRRLSSTFIEFELAWKDILLPFNSRALLAALLAAPEEWRKPPDYRLYTAIMQSLWPEVLLEPINPNISGRAIARKWVKKMLGPVHATAKAAMLRVSRKPG